MLVSACIYLLAAVISVPIAKRLGMGSVLGYLLAGVIIGPFALGLVADQTEIMHFAEFGVVMMLFLIGLELQPSRLWSMRKSILGLGGGQVAATMVAIFSAVYFLTSLPWQTSLAIGAAVALSSTAIVIQSLNERGLMKTQAGQNSFSVLLFQDIVVIPILALLPLLAIGEIQHHGNSAHHTNLIEHLPVLAQVGITIAIIIGIIVGGKYFANPIFRFIAETRLRDIFTAFALLIVVAIATVMTSIGLSPALGSFLAGVVLAENEFRHELEVNIAPFKGLLLGLFFITVGASIDFKLLLDQPGVILGAVLALFVIKAAVLGALALSFNMGKRQGLLFTVALAQGGEFAFVIVASGKSLAVFDTYVGNMITVIVAISMLISPLFLVAYEALMSKPKDAEHKEEDKDIEATDEVIIAGYGRFGQIIGRLLAAQGYHLTILDHSPSQIELLRRFGNTVFYGDAARKDLLHAAGAESAKLLVIAVDEADKSLEIIHVAQTHFPHLKIFARAIDRRHAYELRKAGIEGFRRETFDSALTLGVQALKSLGVSPTRADRAGSIFREHDEATLEVLAELWGDDNSYGVAVRQRMEDLKQVLQEDKKAMEEVEQQYISSPETKHN